MKGHMKDGKFHPHTDYKKGIRKSRDQTAKTEGVKIERKSRGDIKPNLPKAYTPEWDKLKENVEKRFDHDFNQIRLENLQKVNEYWFEDVITAEPTNEMIKDHLGVKTLKGVEEDKIEDAKEELYNDQREIMWELCLKQRTLCLQRKLRKTVMH